MFRAAWQEPALAFGAVLAFLAGGSLAYVTVGLFEGDGEILLAGVVFALGLANVAAEGSLS